jgi:hypothetical protein
MEQVIEIVKIIYLGWFVVQFTPLHRAMSLLPFKVIKNENMREIIKFIILQPFKCYKCSGFWIGLIFWQNIWLALSASFILYLLEKNDII